jgi:hypothetical protein
MVDSKVAYADFVAAMMARLIVLWLLGTSEKQIGVSRSLFSTRCRWPRLLRPPVENRRNPDLPPPVRRTENGSQLCPAQPERVADHGDRAKGHSGTRDHRT